MQSRTVFLLAVCCGLALADVVASHADDAKKSVTVTPEPRSAEHFVKAHQSFLEIAKKGDVDVLFLGDSITNLWREYGKAVWAKNYGTLKAANFGINGDRTQHLLWRIQNGELEGIKPKVVVLMIGTNNTNATEDPACSAADVADGVTEIVKNIHKTLPDTKVLLLAIFPRAYKVKGLPNGENDKVIEANKLIAKLDDGKSVRFLDIGSKFLGTDKQIPKEVMYDALHLTEKGYEIWAEAMAPTLNELLGKK